MFGKIFAVGENAAAAHGKMPRGGARNGRRKKLVFVSKMIENPKKLRYIKHENQYQRAAGSRRTPKGRFAAGKPRPF